MFKLPVEKLSALFAAVAGKEALYIPADDASGQARYQRWHEGMEMTYALNTVRSAKDFFFPQTENLVDFKVKGKEIEIIDPRTEHEDFVIFGVRACDARSFTVLDKVFLADPVDSYYKSRREHGTIVTLACTHPEETCFCSVFGIDPAQPEGDARCWMDEKNLYIEAVTEKGEAFVASVKDQLAEGGEEEVAAQQKATRAVVEKLPLHKLSLEGFGGENMLKLFNSDKWAGLSSPAWAAAPAPSSAPPCLLYTSPSPRD